MDNVLNQDQQYLRLSSSLAQIHRVDLEQFSTSKAAVIAIRQTGVPSRQMRQIVQHTGSAAKMVKHNASTTKMQPLLGYNVIMLSGKIFFRSKSQSLQEKLQKSISLVETTKVI